MLKLSIITINLNNATGLRKTIESVVSQTFQNIEFLVIDGGSMDGSVEVIKEFADKISWWVSETDSGIYNAMNKGILKSTGEYCQFLNSGDWLADDDVIEKMIALLPDCSVFYGNLIKQMPNGKTYRDTCEKGNVTMFTFYRGALNHSSTFIKRNLFDKYGLYDESLRIVADWKWFLIVIGLKNEKVKYINLDVTCFDMSGISNISCVLEKQERRDVLEELLPEKVLADYDAQWQNIEQATRVNRYSITSQFFWLTDRILFKLEKIKSRRAQ